MASVARLNAYKELIVHQQWQRREMEHLNRQKERALIPSNSMVVIQIDWQSQHTTKMPNWPRDGKAGDFDQHLIGVVIHAPPGQFQFNETVGRPTVPCSAPPAGAPSSASPAAASSSACPAAASFSASPAAASFSASPAAASSSASPAAVPAADDAAAASGANAPDGPANAESSRKAGVLRLAFLLYEHLGSNGGDETVEVLLRTLKLMINDCHED